MATQRMWHDLVETQLDEALNASSRTREVQARLALLTGSASAPDGSVRVLVDHHGFVTEVQVTDRAKELGGDGLAARVVELAREALTDLRRKAAPIQAELAAPPVDLHDTTMMDELDAALRGHRAGDSS